MPDTTPEVRFVEDAELRSETEGGAHYIVGRLIPYNVPAVIAGRFEETIAPSCFRKSIQEAAAQAPLMVNHQHDLMPIGSAREWDDREDGLYCRWAMADTAAAREVWGLVNDGHLRGLSAGFLPIKSEWEFRDLPLLDRVTRKEARMLESSLTPMPTWENAQVLLSRTSEGRLKTTPRADAYRAWLQTIAR